MTDSRMVIRVLAIGCIIAALAGVILLSDTGQNWCVTPEGLLEYSLSTPDYELEELETADNYTLYEVRFTSRETEIEGLLRMPVAQSQQQVEVPSVVLLPGATVTKESEQGLATYLCSLGYASIALDQRNLGVIDIPGDLQVFMNGEEPTEHKMVYDALAAAAILRNQPGIDPNRVVYAGESNGARFAIIACALDPEARGVVAISTCGYGIDAAIASGRLTDPEMMRFYQSIDPETYLGEIPPRKFVMLHSINDTIIDYESAEQTFSKASEPKELHTVTCTTHGYCAAEMAEALKAELEGMVA
ncbi:MAG: acetylxylan esterase [Methanomicrobia archaeon]|nr:acetylxylan esterase [Methanomicrobia archaeon]